MGEGEREGAGEGRHSRRGRFSPMKNVRSLAVSNMRQMFAMTFDISHRGCSGIANRVL